MSRRNTTNFQTIHSEGGLLPPDLLRRILDPKEKIPGTKPEDYGLPQGERINEVITQSWNRLRRHWAEFRNAVATATGSANSASACCPPVPGLKSTGARMPSTASSVRLPSTWWVAG